MNISRIDRLVEEADGRAEAARQLRDIARKYPDLLELAIGTGSDGTSTRPRRQRKTTRRKSTPSPAHGSGRKVPTVQLVVAYLREHGECPANAVAHDLSSKITTTVSPPSKIIYATLVGLRRNGKIFSRPGPDGKQLYRAEAFAKD